MEVKMIQFEQLNEEEMWEAIRHKKELSLIISDRITNFSSNIPDVDFSSEKEVPPTSIIFTREGMAQVIYYSGSDIEGKYIKFVVFIYACGGKIFYKDLRNGFYEARVSW
jgi:hypothetical protein